MKRDLLGRAARNREPSLLRRDPKCAFKQKEQGPEERLIWTSFWGSIAARELSKRNDLERNFFTTSPQDGISQHM